MLQEKKGTLIYHFDDETVVIEAWGKDSLRVRSCCLAEMPQNDWALLSDQVQPKAEITVNDDYAIIKNGKITATISSTGTIVYQNQKGEVLLEEYVRNRKVYKNIPGVIQTQGFASALDIEAREFKPILGGDYQLTVRFESDPDEKIYGLGQYQQPYLNQKGCELELAQRNSQASVPFAVSSRGYGFLWNNPAIGRVTLAKNLTEWTSVSTKIMDYWITAGDTPAEIMSNYAGATGKVPMMPEWAMGFWQCKLRYQTQEELLTVAREYKKRNIPISVIVIDFFHWTCQGDWKFDPEYWPDPQAMVDELKEMGIELMISIWPTVDHQSENFEEMEEKGYLIRSDRGQRISMLFQGNTIHFDATNPDAREYVWQKAKKNYYDYGIKLFWLDEAEPEYNFYDFDVYRYHMGPNVQIGNIFPMMYAKGFYDGMQAEGQENIINLLRCAWAGSQRYGALVWSGDIDSSFQSLRNQFTAGLNMGMAGIPWWTTDIGGFHGGNPDDPEFRECLMRWFQYGTFCPVMRLHGDREPHSEPLGNGKRGGGQCNSGADNEIWSYGEEAYEICKDFINIRERLRPYITGIMQEAHENGTPVMRPMFFEFPDDQAAWEVEDQYFFGKDLLVAPVLHAKQRERTVYLPVGSKWQNVWTGEVFEGGQTINVLAPIEQIPLFTRENSGLKILA